MGNLLVFPDVIVRSGLLIDIVAFESAVGRIFLVLTPAYSLGFKEVDDRFARGADTGEAVASDSVSRSTDSCNIIGLGRMSDGEVVRQSDSLGGNPSEVR